jgi:hypothetical protein
MGGEGMKVLNLFLVVGEVEIVSGVVAEDGEGGGDLGAYVRRRGGKQESNQQ